MPFGLETDELFQRLLEKADHLVVETAGGQSMLQVAEEGFVAMVALKVAVTIGTDSQQFGNGQSLVTEMLSEIEESLVFLDVGVVSADDRSLSGDQPVVFPCRSRRSDGLDVDGGQGNGTGELEEYVLYVEIVHVGSC